MIDDVMNINFKIYIKLINWLMKVVFEFESGINIIFKVLYILCIEIVFIGLLILVLLSVMMLNIIKELLRRFSK